MGEILCTIFKKEGKRRETIPTRRGRGTIQSPEHWKDSIWGTDSKTTRLRKFVVTRGVGKGDKSRMSENEFPNVFRKVQFDKMRVLHIRFVLQAHISQHPPPVSLVHGFNPRPFTVSSTDPGTLSEQAIDRGKEFADLLRTP